jgi:hypothetical protein
MKVKKKVGAEETTRTTFVEVISQSRKFKKKKKKIIKAW